MGSYSGESWMRACLGSLPGGRPEGVSVESVLRRLGARVLVLKERYRFEIFLLKREDREGGESGGRVEARSSVFSLFESW